MNVVLWYKMCDHHYVKLLRKVYIKRKICGESNFVVAFWKSGERGLERETERVKSFV